MANEQRSSKPHDRMTRLADAAVKALEADSEYEPGIKCCVFLDDGVNAGMVLHGYEDTGEAIADVLVHVRAMLRTQGQDMQIHALGGRG